VQVVVGASHGARGAEGARDAVFGWTQVGGVRRGRPDTSRSASQRALTAFSTENTEKSHRERPQRTATAEALLTALAVGVLCGSSLWLLSVSSVLKAVRARCARESRLSLEPVPAHDLQQARVVGETERARGAGDVPFVPLERVDDDLSLRLRLEIDKGARGRLASVRWS
jgi:hypothetical protein